jgi:hypothetical protein
LDLPPIKKIYKRRIKTHTPKQIAAQECLSFIKTLQVKEEEF